MKALIVIDIQREYISTGRSFHIGSIGPSLQNAYLMLQHARKEGWPIVHVQHLQDGNLFNAASDTSDSLTVLFLKGVKLMRSRVTTLRFPRPTSWISLSSMPTTSLW